MKNCAKLSTVGLVQEKVAIDRHANEFFIYASIGRQIQLINSKLQPISQSILFIDKEITSIASLSGSQECLVAFNDGLVIKLKRLQTIVWEYRSDKSIQQMMVFGQWILCINNTNHLIIIDSEDGQVLGQMNTWEISALEHPSTLLNKVVLGTTKGELILFNVKTMQMIHQFKCIKGASEISILKQTPAIDIVAVGRGDGRVELINIKQDKLLMTFNHPLAVKSIAFNHDNVMITQQPNQLFLWNLTEKKLIKIVDELSIERLEFMNSQTILAFGYNSIKQLQLNNNDFVTVRSRIGFRNAPSQVMELKSHWFLCVCGNELFKVNQMTNNIRMIYSCAEMIENVAIIDIDEDLIIVGTNDNQITLLRDNQILKSIHLENAISQICANRQRMFILFRDGSIEEFSIPSLNLLKQVFFQGTSQSIQLMKNKSRLLIAGPQNLMNAQGEELFRLTGSSIDGIRVKNQMIMILTNDGYSIEIIDSVNWKIVRSLELDSRAVTCEFSPDGRSLFISLISKHLLVYQLIPHKIVETIDLPSVAVALTCSSASETLLLCFLNELSLFCLPLEFDSAIEFSSPDDSMNNQITMCNVDTLQQQQKLSEENTVKREEEEHEDGSIPFFLSQVPQELKKEFEEGKILKGSDKITETGLNKRLKEGQEILTFLKQLSYAQLNFEVQLLTDLDAFVCQLIKETHGFKCNFDFVQLVMNLLINHHMEKLMENPVAAMNEYLSLMSNQWSLLDLKMSSILSSIDFLLYD